MTIKQLIKLEDKAKEVWVISPTLHYDTENKDFTELVSVNLGEKTKYRYIVPASRTVAKNLKVFKKTYKVTDAEMQKIFCILPESEFNPFIQEIAIYNASNECVACAGSSTEDTNDVIKFDQAHAKDMAKAFKSIWRKYKLTNP